MLESTAGRLYDTSRYDDYEESSHLTPERDDNGDLTPEILSERKIINPINELHAPRLIMMQNETIVTQAQSRTRQHTEVLRHSTNMVNFSRKPKK